MVKKGERIVEDGVTRLCRCPTCGREWVWQGDGVFPPPAITSECGCKVETSASGVTCEGRPLMAMDERPE